MHYTFKKNVYLIKGYKNGLIIDLNTCKVYHINKEAILFIKKIQDNVNELEMAASEKEALNSLINSGLLEAKDTIQEKNLKQQLFHPKIKFAWIEVTDKCNLKCRHCYNESSCSRSKEMDVDFYQAVIDQLVSCNIKAIQIIGGEPLVLGNKVKQFMEYANGKFNAIEIFTNGTLLTEEYVQYFAKRNIKVALSVYSYNAEEHDKVTLSKGSFQKTMEAIQMLKKYGVNYRIANVKMKDITIGKRNTDLFDLDQRSDTVRLSGRGSLALLSDDLIKQKLITKDTFTRPVNPHMVLNAMKGHNCFGHKIYIAADGTVYPCVMERRFDFGTLKVKKLQELINEISFPTKDAIEECKVCEFRYCCFDCRPDSLTGNIYAKPWNCTYNPMKGEWMDIEEYLKKIRMNIL